MAVPSDYTEEQIAEVLEECKGFINAAAAKLNVKSNSLRQVVFNNPALRDLQIEWTERVSDNAELYLVEAVEARKAWAIKLWLSRKARNRGYGQKIEVEGKIDGDSVIRVYEFPDDGREANGNDGNDQTAAGTADGGIPQ